MHQHQAEQRLALAEALEPPNDSRMKLHHRLPYIYIGSSAIQNTSNVLQQGKYK